jgi:hypothetical protein
MSGNALPLGVGPGAAAGVLSLDYEPEGVTLEPTSFEVSGSAPTQQKLTFSAAETTAAGMTNVMLNLTSPDSESSGGAASASRCSDTSHHRGSICSRPSRNEATVAGSD